MSCIHCSIRNIEAGRTVACDINNLQSGSFHMIRNAYRNALPQHNCMPNNECPFMLAGVPQTTCPLYAE